jgi:hypothetical protein
MSDSEVAKFYEVELVKYNMSLIKFLHNNVLYGIVRNQKCSTTTMMSYVAQALWNADPQEMQSWGSFESNAPGVYIKRPYFKNYERELLECDIRIALWRDPVDKFVAGFYHTMFHPSGANDNLWLGSDCSLDSFIDRFDYYSQNPNVQDHCQTNTARLGDTKHIYTHVFHYTEVRKIADMLGVSSERLHHRKSVERPPLTLDQIDLIENIIEEDIFNGWSQY